MLDSRYRYLCQVSLPYAGRQYYMHEFDLAAPVMREGFEDYLDPVLALVREAGAKVGSAFMTVDERVVGAGETQRRPHPHVDGCFVPSINRWDHQDPDPAPGAWRHFCNNVPMPRMPIIVAANVSACRVWRGMVDAAPRNDGDLSHARHLLDEGELVPENVGALLSPDCVHESVPMAAATRRSFLRIALPANYVGDWR